MTPDDLDLIPTPDLLAALARRFNTCVFAGVRELQNWTSDDFYFFAGHRYIAQGLAVDLAIQIREKARKSAGPAKTL